MTDLGYSLDDTVVGDIERALRRGAESIENTHGTDPEPCDAGELTPAMLAMIAHVMDQAGEFSTLLEVGGDAISQGGQDYVFVDEQAKEDFSRIDD